MNVFDTLGPVMTGPSSSHTAGAARIGKITLALLGALVVKADILLHGFFAKTYEGHGIDKVLIVGIMGMAMDDSRICRASGPAREQGLEVNIVTDDIDGAHPNTARVTLTDAAGSTVLLLGSSIGGGSIFAGEVNGMEVSITGQYTTLIVLHRDVSGTTAAVMEVMADAGVNICNFRLSRWSQGGEAMMTIEVGGSFGPELNERVKMSPNIFSSTTP